MEICIVESEKGWCLMSQVVQLVKLLRQAYRVKLRILMLGVGQTSSEFISCKLLSTSAREPITNTAQAFYQR
jgi:hypothetical protein